MMEREVLYPFKWEDVENDSNGITNFKFALSTPGGHLLRKGVANIAESIYNMEVRSDDIWLVAHPKTGSNMFKEVVWDVAFGVKMAKPTKYYDWISLVEMTGTLPEMTINMLKSGNVPPQYQKYFENLDEKSLNYYADSVGYMEARESPRLLKSHLPLELLPPDLLKTAKVTCIARNPKSVCSSLFHHMNNKPGIVSNFNGTYEDFAQLFIEGKLGCGDFFKHLKGVWAQRGNPNFFFVWYENVRKDMPKVIRELAGFLGEEISEEDVQLLTESMKKENFRKRFLDLKIGQTPQVAQKFFEGFVRDDKREEPTISAEMNAKFDAWIEENIKSGGLEEARDILMGQSA